MVELGSFYFNSKHCAHVIIPNPRKLKWCAHCFCTKQINLNKAAQCCNWDASGIREDSGLPGCGSGRWRLVAQSRALSLGNFKPSVINGVILFLMFPRWLIYPRIFSKIPSFSSHKLGINNVGHNCAGRMDIKINGSLSSPVIKYLA